MSAMKATWAVLATAALLSCDSGSASEGFPAASAAASNGEAVTYPNGHTLLLPTEDAGTLWRESEIVQLVNTHRVSIGLNALIDDAAVRDLARGHSQHMIAHRFFSHTNPEGLTFDDRFTEAGIEWSHAGENIAAGYGTAAAAFQAWMASPGHKENIERDLWTHTGVGYAADPTPTASFPYVHYWTQEFLRP